MKRKNRFRNKHLRIPMTPHPGVTRLVACAACRWGDVMVTSIRHFDINMLNQIRHFSRNTKKYMNTKREQQGFVCQFGNWMTREEALVVAKASGQYGRYREPSNHPTELFSEDYV